MICSILFSACSRYTTISKLESCEPLLIPTLKSFIALNLLVSIRLLLVQVLIRIRVFGAFRLFLFAMAAERIIFAFLFCECIPANARARISRA